jgi:hypothetical protein
MLVRYFLVVLCWVIVVNLNQSVFIGIYLYLAGSYWGFPILRILDIQTSRVQWAHSVYSLLHIDNRHEWSYQ